MYEDAIKLANFRDNDIQNDKKLLQQLITTPLSVPETWDKIVHIRNGAIRYAACESFLSDQIGKGEVRQAGDIRAVYSLSDANISLPCGSDTRRQITVSFDSLPHLFECPNTKDDKFSKEEKAAEAYASLLRQHSPIPERVRLRVQGSKEWTNWECYLYYIFLLYPSDLIHGREELNIGKQNRMRRGWRRKDRDKKKWADWNAQRQTVMFFKENIYPKLQMFEMPVMIQVGQLTLSVDEVSKRTLRSTT